MERCIAWMVIERMSQVHGREGIISHYVLYFFTLYEQHVVPRRIIPSYILYDDLLEANYIIEVGYCTGGLWGKPHDPWCAPLAPHFTFMILCCRMIVVANKWLKGHLLFFFLRQARDALRCFQIGRAHV